MGRFGIAAGFYAVTQWGYGLWSDNSATGFKKSEHPTSIVAGNYLGLIELATSGPRTGFGEWQNDRHYFYGMQISRDLLKLAGWNGDPFNVHWTMNRANDTILTDPQTASVPEPLRMVSDINGGYWLDPIQNT